MNKKGFASTRPAIFGLALLLGLSPVSALAAGNPAAHALSNTAVASPLAAASSIPLSDADRIELTRESRALFQLSQLLESEFRKAGVYDSFVELSRSAYAIASDPASTRTELQAALGQLDAFPPIDLFWEIGMINLEMVMVQREMDLHVYTEYGSEPGQWTEAAGQQAMDKIAAFRDDLYPNGSPPDFTRKSFLIFWDYLNYLSAFEDMRNGRNALLQNLFDYRTDVLNRLASGQLSASQTTSFDDRVQALQRRLAELGSQAEIASAFAQVKSAYEALPPSVQPQTGLAADLEAARKLLDLPKGIRSGQYPASAFGDLRRAINEANLVLKWGSTPSEMAQAQSKLAAAVAEFYSRKKP